jgi:hypothetical protein
MTVGRRTSGHVRDIARMKRRGETGEFLGAQGGDDLVGSAVRSQQDALPRGRMSRISFSSAKSSSIPLSGLVMTTPNDRMRNRCRASACPTEYSMGKLFAASASPISRPTWV